MSGTLCRAGIPRTLSGTLCRAVSPRTVEAVAVPHLPSRDCDYEATHLAMCCLSSNQGDGIRDFKSQIKYHS